MAEQRDGVQSLRVDGPDPGIGLQTPESMVDRSVRFHRKLPTPPLIDPKGVEEHIRRTMDKLRTHKVFRRHLGGAQNNDSDSSISTVGLQNLCSITAPVISGRRRMAANFPVSERRTTGSAVINDAVQRGASDVSNVPLRSDMFAPVVSPFVINVDPTWGLNEAPMRSDKSVVGQSVASKTVNIPSSRYNMSVPPVSSVSGLSLDDRFSHFMDVVNSAVSEKLTTTLIAPVQSTPIYTSSNPYSYAYVNPNDVVASTHTEVNRFDGRDCISTDRRPNVLADSSLDDDTDNENPPERKQSYAAKTPRRPKPYNQSCSKRHETVHWEDEN